MNIKINVLSQIRRRSLLQITILCATEKLNSFWEKKNYPFNNSGSKSGDYEEIREKQFTKLLSNGSLYLQNVKEDREGFYLCQAHNGIGTGISKVIQLKVNCKYEQVNIFHGTSRTAYIPDDVACRFFILFFAYITNKHKLKYQKAEQ